VVSRLTNGFQLAADGIYRCCAFQEFLWQSHGFGTRAANPEADVTLRQIHSDLVLNADGLTDRQCEGDALITNKPHLSIGVRTADCVPILLLDSRQRAIAAVHAGWRGSAHAIVRATLRKMNADFGTEPADIYAAIGPCIRECCYEVGQEVAERFCVTFPEWTPHAGKRHVDLAEANRRQMLSAGVPVSSIFDIQTCTSCQIESFYSFRREPQNPGRLLSAISRLA
jgi:YfiH family protein